MDLLVTVVNAAVVGAAGLALWWAFRGRFETLEKVDHLETSLRSEIAAVRSDLTMVALAVGAGPRAENP
jgi:hypothetical protein